MLLVVAYENWRPRMSSLSKRYPCHHIRAYHITTYLEGIDDDGGLELVLEVGEAEDDLLSRALLPLDKADRLVPGEGSEYIYKPN